MAFKRPHCVPPPTRNGQQIGHLQERPQSYGGAHQRGLGTEAHSSSWAGGGGQGDHWACGTPLGEVSRLPNRSPFPQGGKWGRLPAHLRPWGLWPLFTPTLSERSTWHWDSRPRVT